MKKSIFKKTFLIIALSMFLTVSPIATPKTNAFWGEFIQEGFHFVLQNVKDMVLDMLKGTLKQEAAKTLNNQVDSLMSGGGSGSEPFVSNWQDYLVDQPKKDAMAYTNDYISKSTSGRNSASGYKPESAHGNYMGNLGKGAKESLAKSTEEPKPTYEFMPEEMFKDGNFKNYDNYVSGVNNPWSYNANVQSMYDDKYVETKDTLTTKSVAYQGFKGANGEKADSTVTAPGILAKEAAANVADIPNKVLAQANGIPEIISTIISGMMTKVMSQGFSGVQKNSQNSADIENRLDSYIDSSMSQSGPGARFEGN